MKKIFLVLLNVIVILMLSSCNIDNDKYQMIVPNGTPLLGLSSYLTDHHQIEYSVAVGSDPLIAAFTNASYDLICAPVNLGAKLYAINSEYVLFKTIVWGNLYIITTDEYQTLNDLKNQTITTFGINSTPDILLKALNNHYNLNLTIKYVDDVATANALLLTNEESIIVSAEPSLSNIKTKLNNKGVSYHVIDLQEAYQTMTGNASYPQAGVFVKKTEKEKLSNTLNKLTEYINNISIEKLASDAINIDKSFQTMGINVLQMAIPNCHFGIIENEKKAIEEYFTILINLGFGKQIGESLPTDEFYY